jgi:hypothetical protein
MGSLHHTYEVALRILRFGMWHPLVWQKLTDVLEGQLCWYSVLCAFLECFAANVRYAARTVWCICEQLMFPNIRFEVLMAVTLKTPDCRVPQSIGHHSSHFEILYALSSASSPLSVVTLKQESGL